MDIIFTVRVGDTVLIGKERRLVKKRYRNVCGENIYILDNKKWVRECDIDNPTRQDVIPVKYDLREVVCRRRKPTEKLFVKFNFVSTKGVVFYVDKYNGLWTEDELVEC